MHIINQSVFSIFRHKIACALIGIHSVDSANTISYRTCYPKVNMIKTGIVVDLLLYFILLLSSVSNAQGKVFV